MRQERERRGWTHEQLAVAAGVSRNTVSRLEAGRAVQRGSRKLILRALDLNDDPFDLSAIPDEHLVRELERRRIGRAPRTREQLAAEVEGRAPPPEAAPSGVAER